MAISIQDLIDLNRERVHPKKEYLGQCRDIWELYRDDALELMVRDLGLPHEAGAPLTINLLRRVINRIAVAYDMPPVYKLHRDDVVIDAEDPARVAIERMHMRSRYWLAFKEINSLRELWSSLAVRTYFRSSEGQNRLRHQPIMPWNLLRDPSPAMPEDISGDRHIAIKLGDDDHYELWSRADPDVADSPWLMHIVDVEGRVIDEPFGPAGDNPYGVLPIIMLHNTANVEGLPLLPVRASRIDFQKQINRSFTDFAKIIEMQTAVQMVAEHDDTADGTTVSQQFTIGPDEVINLQRGTRLTTLEYRPILDTAMDVMKQMAAAWEEADGLPPGFFASDSNRIYTSSTELWLAQQPLQERRNQMLPLVQAEQEQMHRINVAVHNHHASSLGLPIIDPSIGMQVTGIGNYQILLDPMMQFDLWERENAKGLASRKDYIAARYQITSAEAADRLAQIEADLALEEPVPAEPPDAPMLGSRSLFPGDA